MTIYIVVLHYGEINNTLNCLKSVAKLNRDKMKLKVILVDNDKIHFSGVPYRINPLGTWKVLDKIKIIYNTRNLGFAAGINVGIREALKDKKTDYILLLNNDTIVPPDLLTELLKTPVDITSPILKYKNSIGQWRYDFGGKINWLIGRTNHLESNNLTIQPASPAGRQFNNSIIDYVSGCCMLVKREVFEKIGLFDERFFMYFEDADFCTRAKKEGFKIKVNPHVIIDHLLAASIGRGSGKAISNNLRGNFIFINKHLGWRRLIGYFYLLLLSGKILFNYLKSIDE